MVGADIFVNGDFGEEFRVNGAPSGTAKLRACSSPYIKLKFCQSSPLQHRICLVLTDLLGLLNPLGLGLFLLENFLDALETLGDRP